MNKFFQKSTAVVVLCGVMLASSCTDDPALPDNLAQFEADSQGLAAAESELTVVLKTDRAVDADGNIVINFEATGVTYGKEFTTEPAAVGNVITVPVTAAATTASFKVKRITTSALTGTEKIVFTINTVADGLVLGEKKTFTLSFSEIIASNATVDVDGGGATYPNTVYIDLSANRQTAVSRATWDLAFYNGDDFRVLMNSPNGMLAAKLTKTDIASVVAADSAGLGTKMSLAAIFGMAASATDPSTLPDWVKNSTVWMDNATGDLTKNAMGVVSSTEAENKVFIINRGTGVATAAGVAAPSLGWKKIRVVRNGSNYTLQHADIGSSTFTTVQITKSADTRFTYVSFANGVVGVEPAKTKWDIAWTGFTNTTNFGPGTPTIPYYFQDMIIQNSLNSTGVQSFTYITNTTTQLKTYDTFTEADLASLPNPWSATLSSQINIGSSWRTTGPPPSPVGVRTDRFYIIKDADGNIYKLQFTALTTNAERGKPSFKYALLKKA